MGPAVGAIILFWVCIALGKRFGDEIANWVVGHEEDDDLVPEFGIEWIRTHDGHRPSLKAYRYYVTRYRQLRRARGEDLRLARRFDLVYYGQYVVFALGFCWILAWPLINS